MNVTITDQEIQSFAHTFVSGVYQDRTGIDQERARLVLRAILRRVVSEQVSAMECLGGLGDWSRDRLGELLSNAAEIEVTQILGTFSQAFAAAMKTHAGPATEPPTSAVPPRDDGGHVAGPCTNDPATKAREVTETLDRVCPPESPYQVPMRTLFMRGAFRHAEDVAYARIMLERGDDVDKIEAELHKPYRDMNYCCDPVYPS